MTRKDLENLLVRINSLREDPLYQVWAGKQDEDTERCVAICVAFDEELYVEGLNCRLKYTKHLINLNIVDQVAALCEKEGLTIPKYEPLLVKEV